MRLLLFLLVGCTGSPDSVTVYGGRNTTAYDTPAGSPAYDADGYSYGLGLTWNLPTTRSRREEERDREMLEYLRAVERNTHDIVVTSMEPTVIQGPPVLGPPAPEPEKKPEDELTLKVKSALGAATAALLVILGLAIKKMLGRHKAKATHGGK